MVLIYFLFSIAFLLSYLVSVIYYPPLRVLAVYTAIVAIILIGIHFFHRIIRRVEIYLNRKKKQEAQDQKNRDENTDNPNSCVNSDEEQSCDPIYPATASEDEKDNDIATAPVRTNSEMSFFSLLILFLYLIVAILSGIFMIFGSARDYVAEFGNSFFNFFQSRRVVNNNAVLAGIRSLDKFYTGVAVILLEDLKHNEGIISDNYLIGVCEKKYRVYYGYSSIGKLIDDPEVMANVCTGNYKKLPKPEILATNAENSVIKGKYNLSDPCHLWDTHIGMRNRLLQLNIQNYRVFNVEDSQRQLMMFLQFGCTGEELLKKKAQSNNAGNEDVTTKTKDPKITQNNNEKNGDKNGDNNDESQAQQNPVDTKEPAQVQ